jgi:hypothetical protein
MTMADVNFALAALAAEINKGTHEYVQGEYKYFDFGLDGADPDTIYTGGDCAGSHAWTPGERCGLWKDHGHHRTARVVLAEIGAEGLLDVWL